MGKTDKIALTPEQERWLVAHFRHTKNDDIMERLGISHSTLHRKARELGLTKSRQHMRKTQRNAADKAKASHLRNGTYPPKGYIIPRSEEFRFKAGVTPVERLGKRIADIKADGYIVYTEMVTDPATGKRYARYSM